MATAMTAILQKNKGVCHHGVATEVFGLTSTYLEREVWGKKKKEIVGDRFSPSFVIKPFLASLTRYHILFNF